MKIEVSIGEIIDKITILQIKEKNIKNKKKLLYVKQELSILQDTLHREGIDIPKKMVDNFGDQFIEHARLDAILNDKRFLAKNIINNHCNSTIKEQKSYEGLYSAD